MSQSTSSDASAAEKFTDDSSTSISNAAAAEQLISILFGFMTTQALSLAAKLGIADHLKDGPKPVAELALMAHVQPQPLYRLLRALAGVGIFAEEDNKNFRLTP